MTVEEFAPGAPRLRLAPILRFQRSRDLSQVAPPILDAATSMMALAEQLAEPRVLFATVPIEHLDAASLVLRGGPVFAGRCFATHLAGAREVVCFLVTLGPALDERATAMTDGGELLEALFLDTAGWLALEDAVRAFRASLGARWRPRRLRVSPRLGPGYLDWGLSEQAAFFSVFRGAPLPVRLSEYCVMTPKKSVSGLFGAIPRD